MSKAIEFLESHQSESESKFQERAEWRRKNKSWLELSRHLAIQILQLLREADKTPEDLYQGTGIDPSLKILNGSHDFTLEEIAKVEVYLGKKLIEINGRQRKDEETPNQEV